MKCLSIVVTVLVVMGLVSVVAMGQVGKGKNRLALTRQIMGGFVHPNFTAIEKWAKESPAKGWNDLATNAALLNEASYLLMDDSRCPDDDWAKAALALRAGSAAILTKIEAKDAEGIRVESSCAFGVYGFSFMPAILVWLDQSRGAGGVAVDFTLWGDGPGERAESSTTVESLWYARVGYRSSTHTSGGPLSTDGRKR